MTVPYYSSPPRLCITFLIIQWSVVNYSPRDVQTYIKHKIRCNLNNGFGSTEIFSTEQCTLAWLTVLFSTVSSRRNALLFILGLFLSDL